MHDVHGDIIGGEHQSESSRTQCRRAEIRRDDDRAQHRPATRGSGENRHRRPVQHGDGGFDAQQSIDGVVAADTHCDERGATRLGPAGDAVRREAFLDDQRDVLSVSRAAELCLNGLGHALATLPVEVVGTRSVRQNF